MIMKIIPLESWHVHETSRKYAKKLDSGESSSKRTTSGWMTSCHIFTMIIVKKKLKVLCVNRYLA